jgi:hypothetical protein
MRWFVLIMFLMFLLTGGMMALGIGLGKYDGLLIIFAWCNGFVFVAMLVEFMRLFK